MENYTVLLRLIGLSISNKLLLVNLQVDAMFSVGREGCHGDGTGSLWQGQGRCCGPVYEV